MSLQVFSESLVYANKLANNIISKIRNTNWPMTKSYKSYMANVNYDVSCKEKINVKY